jgi:hypothetical protein
MLDVFKIYRGSLLSFLRARQIYHVGKATAAVLRATIKETYVAMLTSRGDLRV